MKWQILFSGKNNKKYFEMSSAENLPRVLRLKKGHGIEGHWYTVDTSKRNINLVQYLQLSNTTADLASSKSGIKLCA